MFQILKCLLQAFYIVIHFNMCTLFYFKYFLLYLYYFLAN